MPELRVVLPTSLYLPSTYLVVGSPQDRKDPKSLLILAKVCLYTALLVLLKSSNFGIARDISIFAFSAAILLWWTAASCLQRKFPN